MSKADCYVQLWLPTASPNHAQTRTVANCSDPEWNQTFHYKIHGAVKVWTSKGGAMEGKGLVQGADRCLPVPRMSWSSLSMTRMSWAVMHSLCSCLT